MAKTNREVAVNREKIKIALKGTSKFKAKSTVALEKETFICPQNIRRSVNELRSIGVPVCASENGYYIEKNRQAVLRYADELALKAGGILRAVEGLKRYGKSLN